MKSFELGGRTVGDGALPVFLPDIGTFFNRDLDAARRLVDAVIESGCGFLKGEVLHRADVCLPGAAIEEYYTLSGATVREPYRELIERKVVSLADYSKLFAQARSGGLRLVLSVYDDEGVAFALDEGACALKIASSNLVHQPLIETGARTGLPVLIDTGKSDLEEIARALSWAREAGAQRLIVEHSPDPPPAPLSQHHLRMLPTLAAAFECPVGLSDHHAGEEMLLAAVALGASVLEKGLCLDRDVPDQDVPHALQASRLKSVLAACRKVHEALGSPMRGLRRDRPRSANRMGLVAARALSPGEILDSRSLRFAFPALGIPVEHASLVAGWIVRRPVPMGAPVGWADLTPPER